ncbi:hypothetical protein Tco_0337626 [Tanacetum coccineum]
MDYGGRDLRVQTINGRYISWSSSMIILDSYWGLSFMRSKYGKTLAVVLKFLVQIQVGLNKIVRFMTPQWHLTANQMADNAGCQTTRISTTGRYIFTQALQRRTDFEIHSPKAWQEQQLTSSTFTASSTIPAIYIQQFWDTIRFDNKAGSFKCQLDEQWFNLNQDTLRDALQITPVNKNRTFSSPPTHDTLVDFVNKLGYPKELLREANAKSLVINKLPNELINNVIREADYYDAYLEKVAKHQRYIAGEELSDPESPAPNPAKPTKQAKPKATEQPTVSKTKAKKSKPAPAKPKEKKRKPVSESSEDHPLAKRAKAGKVVKKRTAKSSSKLVGGGLGGREPDTGKLQPLPEVPGKGKEKVGEEQAAQVLLNLQTPKKKSSTEQYIFQRRSQLPTVNTCSWKKSSSYMPSSDYLALIRSMKEMPSVGRSGNQDEGHEAIRPGVH